MVPRNIIVVIFQSLTAGNAGGMGALGYDIADELHRRGDHVMLYTINKGRFTTTFPSSEVLPFAFYLLWFLNKMIHWRLLTPLAGYKFQEYLYDYCLSKKNLTCDLLITTFPLLPKTLKKNQDNIGKVVLIPQNPNEAFIYETCIAEVQKFDLPQSNDAYIDSWRRKQQSASIPFIDEIASISLITHNSYHDFQGQRYYWPFYLNRTVLKTNTQQPVQPFVFLFVAHVAILKGLHQLLYAWQRLQLPGTELWIVGGINDTLKARLVSNFPTTQVKWFGHQNNVDDFIAKSSVVIIPSLIDNEPHTAVEALALHRPIIISTGCGNAEWIKEFVPEALFRTGDISALQEKMTRFYTDYQGINTKFAPLYEFISRNKSQSKKHIKSLIKHLLNE